ncbi:SNF2-related protein [Rickettsiales bacterium LUAb2]
MSKQLRPYQLEDVDNLVNKKRYALFTEMGLGKTVTTLTAIQKLHHTKQIKKTLLIAPLNICRNEWVKQSKEWDHTKDLTFSVCIGSEKQRLEALNQEAQIYIINVENIPWLIETDNFDFDSVVIDEAHTFKSYKSKRFKALKKVIHTLKSIILLTGTPSPNSFTDLWSLIFLLDQGERLGRNFHVFENRYFNKVGYGGYKLELKKDAKEQILNKIKDIAITRSKADYLDLPPIISIKKSIELDSCSLKKYKQLENDFLVAINSEIIDVPNTASLGNKLLQICNGAIYDKDRTVFELHDEKIKALREILENNPNENFLVAYNFNFDRDRLASEFKEAVVFDGSVEVIMKWNYGKIKLLLCHPKSAGYGLNLQHGGKNIVWYGLSWSLSDYQQFNSRLHRSGQNSTVVVTHIIANDTIDEKVITAIENKAETQTELMLFLKG